MTAVVRELARLSRVIDDAEHKMRALEGVCAVTDVPDDVMAEIDRQWWRVQGERRDALAHAHAVIHMCIGSGPLRHITQEEHARVAAAWKAAA